MNEARFFVTVFTRKKRGRPYRWRCRPSRSIATEQTARRAYQAVRLTKRTRMKALVKRTGDTNTLLDSEGWHMDATTVCNLAGKTIRQKEATCKQNV